MNTPDMMLTALKFNEKINKRDLKGLTELMTEDHTFIDNEGKAVKGKNAMKKGWRQLFEMYPDYQNIFISVTTQNNLVIIIGYSTCSYKQLSGPNMWTAKVHGKRISEWRVYWLGARALFTAVDSQI